MPSIHIASAQTSNPSQSGMVTYTSKDNSFSIQYPQGWQVQENPTNPQAIVMFSDPQGNALFNVDEKQYDTSQHSLKEFAEGAFSMVQKAIPNSALIDEGSLTVSGQDAYFVEYSYSSSGTSLVTKIVLVKIDSNNVFAITFVTTNSDYQDQVKQFDNIVSTFITIGRNTTSNSSTTPNSEPVPTPSQQTSSSSQIQIPSWVKSTAKWWSQGQVGDSDFIKGIQYLMQQGIIQIPAQQPSGTTAQGIPAWIKNNAGWWADGQIPDAEFVKGMQWLVSNGIINPNQSTAPQPSPTPQSKSYTNLSTYTSKDNSFSIHYPQGWQVDDNPRPTTNQVVEILSPDKNSGMGVMLEKGALSQESLTDYVNKLISQSKDNMNSFILSTEGDMTVNGNNAHFFDFVAKVRGTDLRFKELVVPSNNDVYLLIYDTVNVSDNNLFNEFSTMASSFTINSQSATSTTTDSAPSIAGNWVAYTTTDCTPSGNCQQTYPEDFNPFHLNSDGTWTYENNHGTWSVQPLTEQDNTNWAAVHGATLPGYKIDLNGWLGSYAEGPLEIDNGVVKKVWVYLPNTWDTSHMQGAWQLDSFIPSKSPSGQ